MLKSYLWGVQTGHRTALPQFVGNSDSCLRAAQLRFFVEPWPALRLPTGRRLVPLDEGHEREVQ